MKNILFFLILLFYVSKIYCQPNLYLSFDDTTYKKYLFIDKKHYHNNIWQVGKPHKKVFNSAYYGKNVIITDTVKPYSINDTSVFYIKYQRATGITCAFPVSFAMSYKINTDSLKDFGKIEISDDKGNTWHNLDTLLYSSKLILTGDTNAWLNVQAFVNFRIQEGDSVYYRFTFISDSIQTNKDGWMIDQIWLDWYCEDINEHTKNYELQVFPDPADDFINLSIKSSNQQIKKSTTWDAEIYDVLGNKVFSRSFQQTANSIQLPVSNLNDGVYILKIQGKDFTSMKKVVVRH